MKTVKLEVSLSFYDEVYDDNEIRETVKKVLDALVSECVGEISEKHFNMGIAPENTFTTEIEVSELL